MCYTMMETVEAQSFGTGQKQKHIHNVDKMLLDLFWTLAEGDDAQRVHAADKLNQRIIELKAKDADSGLSQQEYCLKRLIRGLASNRKFARIGFAVALTKLLRQATDIKVKHVLAAIGEELKVSGHDPKSEIGGKLLGSVFGYAAVCQSDRHLKSKQLQTIVSELHTLSSKKSYVLLSTTRTLVDLIAHASPEQLREAVWPQLEADLDKGWEGCTPDRLILLLACRQKDKAIVSKDYLQNHWGAAQILGKKNYEHLLHVLMKCVESQQIVPLLLDALSADIALTDEDKVTKFWKKVGNPLLASTVPRKQLALSLFARIVETVSDLSKLEKMLFPGVAGLICKNSGSAHKDQLQELCQKLELQLLEKCKGLADSKGILSLIKSFIVSSQHQDTFNFLRSPSFQSMVSLLQGETVEEFSSLCMNFLTGTEEILKELGNEQERKTVLEKISLLLVPCLNIAAVNQSVMESDLAFRILQFLFLHAFFKVKLSAKDIPFCGYPGIELSTPQRNVCQSTFYRNLTHLLSTRPVLNYIQILIELARYAQKLLKSPAVNPVRDISEAVRSEWQIVLDMISPRTSKKHTSKSTQMGETEAFTLLLLHLAFDMFKDEEVIELLQDIKVCHQKAVAKQDQSKSNDQEPLWIEVVTSNLLSMLLKPSKLARKTAEAVFKSLSAHYTPGAVQLITEVFTDDKAVTDIEVESVEDEDEEMLSDSDDEDKKDFSSDTENKDKSNATEEEDDDEEEEEEGEVDEEFRQSVKKALGPAAVDSDDDEDMEDLSDSEMFRLDEGLAAIMRQLKQRKDAKKEKKEKDKAVASLKLRAFDLLEVIVKGDRCGDFVLDMMEPLLVLVTLKHSLKGKVREGQQTSLQLSRRATQLFHFLCKQRNLKDNLHSTSQMMDGVRALIAMARQSPSPQFAAEIANGCLCIMRMMSRQSESKPSPVRTRSMRLSQKTAADSSQQVLDSFVETVQLAFDEEFLKHRNPKINVAFFSSLVQKYPTVFWSLNSSILDCLQSTESKVHTKTQACSCLCQLLRSLKRENLSDDEWTSFLSNSSATLTKLVMSQQKLEMKSGLMQEGLSALFYLTAMASDVEKKTIVTEEVKSHLLQLKADFKKDTRRKYNRLMQCLFKASHKKKSGKKRKLNRSEDAPESQSAENPKKAKLTGGSGLQNGTSLTSSKRARKAKHVADISF